MFQPAKRECDKVIDKNGPAPLGTGIKQLRENIAESKLSYEIMDDAAQAFLKTKIMDNIQKYFYLICFCAYLRDQSSSAQSTADEEQKKNFALTGGKGRVTEPFSKYQRNLSISYFLCSFHSHWKPQNLKEVRRLDEREEQPQDHLRRGQG